MNVFYSERGTYELSFEGSANFFWPKLTKLSWFYCWPSETLIFDDVIGKIWWRHQKIPNLIYIFLILVWCTTKLPSLVGFGQILQEITGVGKFTHPQPTYMPDAPQDRVKEGPYYQLHVLIYRKQRQFISFTKWIIHDDQSIRISKYIITVD